MRVQRLSDVLLNSSILSTLSSPVSSSSVAFSNTSTKAQWLRTRCLLAPSSKYRAFSTQRPLRATAAAARKEDDDYPDIPPKQTRANASITPGAMPKPFSSSVAGGKGWSEPRKALTPATAERIRQRLADMTFPVDGRYRTGSEIVEEARKLDRAETETARRQEDLLGTPSTIEILDIQKAVAESGRRSAETRPAPPPLLRTNPYMGRAEKVVGSKTLARSLAHMQAKLQYNQVKQTFQKQRFHERPGLKRKRLKSERWRKRFKDGFRAMIMKVQRMKRQGW